MPTESCLWGLLPCTQGLSCSCRESGDRNQRGGWYELEEGFQAVPGPSSTFFLFPGGYTTGPEPLISLMRQRSRPYLFSNSLPPAVVGCASKALDLLMESNTIIQSMAAKTRRYGAHRGGSEREMVATHLSAFSCPPPSFPSHPFCRILFLQSPVPSLVTPIFPPPIALPAPACAPPALWACTSVFFPSSHQWA